MTNPDPIYRYLFTVQPSALDPNGHVNNVVYVQWMQDVALKHFDSIGGMKLMENTGATWFVRSHHVEYLSPAFVDEQIEARTWIASVRRVRSLRRYEFVRVTDGKLLVRGETEWVHVDAKTGRPVSIPADIESIFPLLPDGETNS